MMGFYIQRFFLCVGIILLSSCHVAIQKKTIIFGSGSDKKVWVYLCGLTSKWDSPQEVKNRKILKRIADAEQIKIAAIKPLYRCSEFDNKLCWPHNDSSQVRNTYSGIIKEMPISQIAGFIGFSNGGFFLNKLAQEVELNRPIISIGSAGCLSTASSSTNKMYLVIGKEDIHHYSGAISFYNQAKEHQYLEVELIEHDYGHIIPEAIVRNIIHELKI